MIDIDTIVFLRYKSGGKFSIQIVDCDFKEITYPPLRDTFKTIPDQIQRVSNMYPALYTVRKWKDFIISYDPIEVILLLNIFIFYLCLLYLQILF